MGVRFAFSIFITLLLLVGCSQGHCRRQADMPAAAQPLAPSPETSAKPSDQDHVFVYKYDGSLQCGMGKPITVEKMAKTLTGIQIFSSEKKPDGLMHIQVCGSNTGLANVFEVPAGSLKKAEAKGFKKWSFE